MFARQYFGDVDALAMPFHMPLLFDFAHREVVGVFNFGQLYRIRPRRWSIYVVRPAPDPVGAITLGAALVLLLALVHFAGRVDGAALGPSVIAVQVRQWLLVVAIGVLAAAALAGAGTALAVTLEGVTLPLVVVAATLGAVLTMAGVIALVTSSRAGR